MPDTVRLLPGSEVLTHVHLYYVLILITESFTIYNVQSIISKSSIHSRKPYRFPFLYVESIMYEWFFVVSITLAPQGKVVLRV